MSAFGTFCWAMHKYHTCERTWIACPHRFFRRQREQARPIRFVVEAQLRKAHKRQLDKANRMLSEATESLKTIVAKVKVWERLLKASDASKESNGYAHQAQQVNPPNEGQGTPTSPSSTSRAHRDFRSASVASAASTEFDSGLGTPGVVEKAAAASAAGFLAGANETQPFTFHPDAPEDVHCPESGVGRVDVKVCWRHTDAHLIWNHREHLHYLIYGQARSVFLRAAGPDIDTGGSNR